MTQGTQRREPRGLPIGGRGGLNAATLDWVFSNQSPKGVAAHLPKCAWVSIQAGYLLSLYLAPHASRAWCPGVNLYQEKLHLGPGDTSRCWLPMVLPL